MKKRWLLAFLLSLATALASAAPQSDGALITNSGSTNTMGYVIKVWSNGGAEITMRGMAPRAFNLDDDVAARFFADVKAARSNPGSPQHCMKSASFGTSTSVAWHGWSSADLQCPPFTEPVGLLAQDVKLIQQAANIDNSIRRLPMPRDVRMIPTATPEVSPT